MNTFVETSTLWGVSFLGGGVGGGTSSTSEVRGTGSGDREGSLGAGRSFAGFIGGLAGGLGLALPTYLEGRPFEDLSGGGFDSPDAVPGRARFGFLGALALALEPVLLWLRVVMVKL